jgi:hypothetical protein
VKIAFQYASSATEQLVLRPWILHQSLSAICIAYFFWWACVLIFLPLNHNVMDPLILFYFFDYLLMQMPCACFFAGFFVCKLKKISNKKKAAADEPEQAEAEGVEDGVEEEIADPVPTAGLKALSANGTTSKAENGRKRDRVTKKPHKQTQTADDGDGSDVEEANEEGDGDAAPAPVPEKKKRVRGIFKKAQAELLAEREAAKKQKQAQEQSRGRKAAVDGKKGKGTAQKGKEEGVKSAVKRGNKDGKVVKRK